MREKRLSLGLTEAEWRDVLYALGNLDHQAEYLREKIRGVLDLFEAARQRDAALASSAGSMFDALEAVDKTLHALPLEVRDVVTGALQAARKARNGG